MPVRKTEVRVRDAAPAPGLVAAKAEGISERSLERAKRQLEIESETVRGDDGRRYWQWVLPPDPPPGLPPPEDLEFDRLPDLLEKEPPGTTDAGRAILARE